MCVSSVFGFERSYQVLRSEKRRLKSRFSKELEKELCEKEVELLLHRVDFVGQRDAINQKRNEVNDQLKVSLPSSTISAH